MFAMAASALSGLWKKPQVNGFPDLPWSGNKLGEEGRHHTGMEEADSNSHYSRGGSWGRIPRLIGAGLSKVKKPSIGTRSDEGSWKRFECELDFVIVPSDACYASPEVGAEYEMCDYSVGWYEPHSPSFTDNEDEEKFQVLVPSYRSPASKIGPANGQGRHETTTRDSNTPPWACFLSNLTHYTNPDVQKEVDLWLESLTSGT